MNNKRLSLLLFLIIVFVSIMSVNAADAGNSSNSNFHKIQIDSNTQNTIDNNTNYYKSNDNLNKNDNINL